MMRPTLRHTLALLAKAPISGKHSFGMTLVVLATAVACANGTGSAPGAIEGPRGNLITFGEVAASGSLTALEAVDRLRPRLLRGQPTGGSREPPGVSIDHGPVVDVSFLATIPAESVVEIRYFEPASARVWFGYRHNGGVILVLTAARPPTRQ